LLLAGRRREGLFLPVSSQKRTAIPVARPVLPSEKRERHCRRRGKGKSIHGPAKEGPSLGAEVRRVDVSQKERGGKKKKCASEPSLRREGGQKIKKKRSRKACSSMEKGKSLRHFRNESKRGKRKERDAFSMRPTSAQKAST